MFETVKKIIVDTLSCDEEEVTLEASLIDDLGADSLSAVEICMALEEEFGVTISDEDIPTLKTVSDIINHLEANKA